MNWFVCQQVIYNFQQEKKLVNLLLRNMARMDNKVGRIEQIRLKKERYQTFERPFSIYKSIN